MSEYRFRRDQQDSQWWQRMLSPGNIIAIVTIIVSVTIAYEKLEGRATANESQTADLKAAVSTLNTTLVDTNLAVRELRTTVLLEGRKTREQNEH